MRSPFLPLALLLVLMPACASTGSQGGVSESAPAATSGAKANKLERELAIARERLSKARMEEDAGTLRARAALEQARAKLALSEARLQTFQDDESPQRMSHKQLDLRNAEDQVGNDREELEQLMLMYAEQDLADKTREIVVRRTQRRLDLSEQRLALQRSELETLEKRTLVEERARLQIDLDEARMALARAEQESQLAEVDGRIGRLSAEAEVARLEQELEESR